MGARRYAAPAGAALFLFVLLPLVDACVKAQPPTDVGSPVGPSSALPEGSVSTSAETANFLTANGKRYGHILDPRTLRPAESGALSVTLHAPDATIADAVSTAALVLGPQRGLAFIDSFPGMMGLLTFRKGGTGRSALR